MIEPAPDRDFNLLYGQASDLLKNLPEFQFKTIAAVVVIIGWLVTSEGARTFVRSVADIAVPANTIAFVLLFIFKVIWIVGYYRRLRSVYRRLVGLAPAVGVSQETLAVFDLSPVLPVTYVVMNGILCAAAVTVVWLIGR